MGQLLTAHRRREGGSEGQGSIVSIDWVLDLRRRIRTEASQYSDQTRPQGGATLGNTRNMQRKIIHNRKLSSQQQKCRFTHLTHPWDILYIVLSLR